MHNNSIFITGTDTGVGKTFVTLGLVKALCELGYKVGVMKPIATGAKLRNGKLISEDAEILNAVNVYAFKAALAPLVAAKLENKKISKEKILAEYEKLRKENDFVLVEGIGGLLVPLMRDYSVADLILDMDAAVVIVARPGLGTINHTLLTINETKRRGIKLLGVIFNEAEKLQRGICERTNPEVIEQESGVSVLGNIGYASPSLRGVSPRNFGAKRRSNLLAKNTKDFSIVTRRLLRALRVLAMTSGSRVIKRYESLDKRYVWHPFTQMSDWRKETPLIIEEGKGSYLKATDGKWYLDGISSLWVNVHGHRKKELDEALAKQINKVSHSTLLGMGNIPSIELAKMLVDIAPKGLTKVFYSDNGSTAVEVGLKIAFQYWQQKCRGGLYGRPNMKTKFISFTDAYHGDTVGSVSVGGIDLFHKKYKPLLFKAIKSPLNAKKLEKILKNQHEEISAVIIEPIVQGAAGMLIQPSGFLKQVRKLCTKYNCFLVCDEVATGFGRTGKMFACEHENVSPDIMTVAKSITGGYLPLAATLTTDEIYNVFYADYSEQKTFFHGHTYTGNPLAAAVAIENLNIFKREKTLQKLQPKILYLKRCLTSFQAQKHVGDIRQKGFMVGVELVKDKKAKIPYDRKEKMGVQVIMKAREKGVILRPLGNVIVLMPPLSITLPELKHLLEVTYWAIQESTM